MKDFMLEREQIVCDIGGVKVGGQPGENPTVRLMHAIAASCGNTRSNCARSFGGPNTQPHVPRWNGCPTFFNASEAKCMSRIVALTICGLGPSSQFSGVHSQ